MFGPLKNMEVGLDDISDNKLLNSINVVINTIKRTFTSINIVKLFEKSQIYHRNYGTKIDRSYFVIDNTRIDENNHNKMGNVLKKLNININNKKITLSTTFD